MPIAEKIWDFYVGPIVNTALLSETVNRPLVYKCVNCPNYMQFDIMVVLVKFYFLRKNVTYLMEIYVLYIIIVTKW